MHTCCSFNVFLKHILLNDEIQYILVLWELSHTPWVTLSFYNDAFSVWMELWNAAPQEHRRCLIGYVALHINTLHYMSHHASLLVPWCMVHLGVSVSLVFGVLRCTIVHELLESFTTFVFRVLTPVKTLGWRALASIKALVLTLP